MGYGGWVTVANLVNPILVYSDRFMIGALFSVAEVGYYAAPFEAVTRLWLVPASLAATLFPAFSAMGIESNRGKVELLYSRAIKSLLLLLGPVVLILIAFAKDVLQIWLGAEFAAKSTSVLQILAVGVLANSFAYIPFSLLQGLGRPDVVAKVFLVELPAYLAFAYVMIARGGIAGAALAWTLRVSIEALVLMVLAWKVFSISPRALVDGGLLRSLAAFAALGMAMLPGQLIFWNAPWIRCALSVFAVSIFVWAVWKYILDDTDRGPIAMMIRLFLPKTEKLR